MIILKVSVVFKFNHREIGSYRNVHICQSIFHKQLVCEGTSSVSASAHSKTGFYSNWLIPWDTPFQRVSEIDNFESVNIEYPFVKEFLIILFPIYRIAKNVDLSEIEKREKFF